MFSTILSYVSIAISVIVAIIFIKKQKKYYKENMARLEKARDFFLETDKYKTTSYEDSQLISTNGIEGHLKDLVNELNKYISRNKGTTDFSIIQNKTERFANTIFENASSNLAFPTYMGLMGTFIGVFIGLVGFVLPDFLNDLGLNLVSEEEANITRLVYGVIVSMITSFMGLYYTTISNRTATEYKRIMDERKNIFYDFIQNELMPVLGMSVVHALNQLKETLLNFHESFDVITKNFEKTFNSCTAKFGKEFEKNITAVGDAASKLGTSIDAVNKNVENQQALLRELRSEGMMKSLDNFVQAGAQFKDSTNSIKLLNGLRNSLEESIKQLMEAQKDYSASLVVPKLIAERLNVILTRVSTFEDSINALGKDIAATHMLGNSEMKRIEVLLEDIKRKDDIALEYQENANTELKALFDKETEIIRSLHRQYTSAIENHGDEFQALMDQVAGAIEKKRIEFINKLETAFSIADLQTEFAQLNKLPEIDSKIGTISEKVGEFESTVKSQSKSEIEKIGEVGDKVVELQKAVETKAQKVQETIESTSQDVKGNIESVATTNEQHIDKVYNDVKQKLTSLESSANEKSAKNLSRLNDIYNEINDVNQIVEKSIKSAQERSDVVQKQFADSLNSLKQQLTTISSTIDEVKKSEENVVNVDMDSLNEAAEQINQQKVELDVLAGLIETSKENISTKFDVLIDQKIKDIEAKFKDVNTKIDKSKQKVDKK